MSEITEQAREDQISAILLEAFKNASKLKLNKTEAKSLMKPFDDKIVEILDGGGIYIPHVYFSKRLNSVFGPAQWILVCRRHAHDKQSNTIRAEYVLVIRGSAVGEETCDAPFEGRDEISIGEDQNYGNALAILRARALRRICSLTLSCGAELYEPTYQQNWTKKHAEEYPFRKIDDATGQIIEIMLWRKKGTVGRKSELSPALPEKKAQAASFTPEDLNIMIRSIADLGAENIQRFALGAGYIQSNQTIWDWSKDKVYIGETELARLREAIKADIEKHGDLANGWKKFRVPFTSYAGTPLEKLDLDTLEKFFHEVDGTHKEFRAALDQAGKEKGFKIEKTKKQKK